VLIGPLVWCVQELSAVASVNQQWKRLSGDESLWKRLYFRRWKDRQLGPRQPHVDHYFTLSALAGTQDAWMHAPTGCAHD
jgi:hypothetical protein